MERFRSVALLALTASLMSGVASASEQAGQLTSGANRLSSDNTIASTDGGKLSAGAHDVLVDQHGTCRWLDNIGPNQYLVPYKTTAEWLAFIASGPEDVTRDACCPIKTISLTASDGQSISYDLPLGREGASDTRGRISFTSQFIVGTGEESVSDTFVCQNGAWVSEGAETETIATTVVTPDVAEDEKAAICTLGLGYDTEYHFPVNGINICYNASGNYWECRNYPRSRKSVRELPRLSPLPAGAMHGAKYDARGVAFDIWAERVSSKRRNLFVKFRGASCDAIFKAQKGY